MQNEYDREAKEKELCKPLARREAPATSTVATTTETVAAVMTKTEAAAAAAVVATETAVSVVAIETAASVDATETAASVVATGIASAVTTTQVEGMVAAPQDPFSSSADASIFKIGELFLAWALWGHIPLNDGTQVVSKLFSNAKPIRRTDVARRLGARCDMR